MCGTGMYFFLEASMPSSLRFLLFRIHLIGMTMSKDVSFNSNNFSSNYFSRSFTFWSILIILIQFQIIVNKWIKVLVSWWSAYFLIFWLADFEYPALLIGLELLLRSLSHCSSLAGEKGLLYVFKWRFGNFQKVSKFLKFGHYTKELEL